MEKCIDNEGDHVEKYYPDNKVSKVGDRSRGWPEGSLFDSYYTEV